MDIGHGKTVIFDPKQNEFVCFVGAIEISVFLKNNFLKKTMLQITIIWCWGIPWVDELSYTYNMPIKCYRLV